MSLRTFLIIPFLALSFSFVDPCVPSSHKGPPQPKPGELIHEVITVYPRFEDRPRMATGKGVFLMSDSLTLKSETGGLIEKVAVNEGDVVKVGDTLCTFNSNKLKSETAQKQAALKEAQTALDHAQRMAEATLTAPKEITEPVFLDEEAPPRITEKQPAKEDWDSKIKQNEAKIETLNKELDLLDKENQKLNVTAPIPGLIKKRYVTDGALIEPSALLFDIVTLDPLTFTFSINGDVSSYVDKMVGITVSPLSAPELHAPGTIFYISPSLDPNNKTLELKAHVSNEHGLFKEGQEARAEILTRKIDKIMIIPKEALITENDKKYIFVVTGPQARKTEVGGGDSVNDREVSIQANLRVDDPVVVRGQSQLQDKSFVKMIKEEGKQAVDK